MNVKDLWSLTRFEHSVMLALAVLVGETVTLRSLPEYGALLAVLPPMLVGAASFALNDYFDVRADKLNKRFDRPLVRGRIKPGAALFLSILLFFSGIGVAWFVNFNSFLLVLVFSLLSFLYSFKLKDVAVVGNAYVALTMAVPFVYGGLAVADRVPPSLLFLSSVAFLSGLGREVMGSARDVRGDRRGRGSATLPVLIGVRNSLLLSSLLYAFSIALSIAPYFYIEPYVNNPFYIFPVVVADLILLQIAVNAFKETSREFMLGSRNLSLIAMFIALLGFLAGALLGG